MKKNSKKPVLPVRYVRLKIRTDGEVCCTCWTNKKKRCPMLGRYGGRLLHCYLFGTISKDMKRLQECKDSEIKSCRYRYEKGRTS